MQATKTTGQNSNLSQVFEENSAAAATTMIDKKNITFNNSNQPGEMIQEGITIEEEDSEAERQTYRLKLHLVKQITDYGSESQRESLTRR